MAQQLEDYDLILEYLRDSTIFNYVTQNLKKSLNSIGFSSEFVNYLTGNLLNLEFDKLKERFSRELDHVYSRGFFQKIVPNYFATYVVPEIRASKKVLDIGTGTGILCHLMSQRQDLEQILGVDLLEYPEWKLFGSEKVRFQKVEEGFSVDYSSSHESFNRTLIVYQPNTVTMTWVIHHMEFEKHDYLFKTLHGLIQKPHRIVILEDAYSQELQPEQGKEIFDDFVRLDNKTRDIVMSVYDWTANRILARRNTVKMPFSYVTLERLGKVVEGAGYTITKKRFIGFPERRDINTPQSVLVVEKI